MRKQAVSNAADSPMQWLEQIAHLAQSARNATLLVERVLHLRQGVGTSHRVERSLNRQKLCRLIHRWAGPG